MHKESLVVCVALVGYSLVNHPSHWSSVMNTMRTNLKACVLKNSLLKLS